MQPAWRLARAIAGLALIPLTALLLHALAQREFSAHLRTQASHALALAARGDTPYRWRFRGDEDIVAGRVFGAHEFQFDDAGLMVRSDGVPLEIGLPLTRPADLSLYPHLRIAAGVDGQAQIAVVVRESLAGPERVLEGEPLQAGAASHVVDLTRSRWTGGESPRTAAMLRLRVSMAAGRVLHIAAVDLLSGAMPLDLSRPPRIVDAGTDLAAGITPIYRLPFRTDLQQEDIATIARTADPLRPTLVLLPLRGRVEQQIALRNAVFAAMPAAILIPETALEKTFAQARAQATQPATHAFDPRWALLVVYAGALVWSRLRPPPAARVRALVEVALTLFGPLWLILFDAFNGRPDAVESILIAVVALYAASLSVPRRWQWNGSARAWGFAFVVIAAALLLGLVLHDGHAPARAISPSHSARYIGWAFVQQYLICAVCTERWRTVTGSDWLAAYLGAVAFALLHTPNAALMIATFAGGLAWCALYLRERALLPLAVSHAASALLLLALLPRDLLASAEVSARFFQ